MGDALYHGSRDGLDAAYVGICLTDDIDVARAYAVHGKLYEVTLADEDSLAFVEVADFDRDGNHAVGDDGVFPTSADVVEYWDETENGCEHYTWRLASAKAVAMATVKELA